MKVRTLQLVEGLVLGLAVAVRVAGLLSFGQTLYARFPMVDAYTYWDQANAMLAGRNPFADGFYQPPGYPAFLWLVARITGGADLSLLRAVQALLGVLTTGMLVLLGRRAGEPLDAPWAGAIAGLVFTLYPTTILFEQDVLTPALTCFLFTASLVLLWDVRPAEPSTGRPAGPGWGRAGAAGLLLGVTVVVHPTYLLAALAIGVWLASLAWRGPTLSPLPRRVGSVAAFSLAFALALAPTTWLNTVTQDEPALVSHNSGLNFYLGNNLEWRKTMFLRPGLPFRKLVLDADPSTRGAAGRNDYWWQRSRAELSAHPMAWLSILGTKAIWSVNNTEIPRNEDYRCRTRAGALAWLGRLPMRYGFVFPFAVCGAFVLGRKSGPTRLVPLSWFFLHLPLVFFLVADRYRLATWPVLSLAAAIGLAGMVQTLRERRVRTRLGWLWLLLVIPLPFLTLDSVTALQPAWCAHVDGNLALMDGDAESAMGLYRQALALDPDDWGARDFLARTVARDGDLDQAVALMEPLIAWFPDHYPSLYFLARTEERRGRYDRAADLMGRAFAVPGKRTHTGVRYVRLLLRAGRRTEARAVLARHPELRGHPGLEGVLE